MVKLYSSQHPGLGDVAVFKNRQPVTVAKFINKSSLLILLLDVIHRLQLNQNSEQKVEPIFVVPPILPNCLLYADYFVSITNKRTDRPNNLNNNKLYTNDRY